MRLTASKIEMAECCPGSFTRKHSRGANDEHANAGTARHAEDEEAIGRGEVPAALADRWPGLEWRAEVAFAYDVSTGVARELGSRIGRAYEAFNLGPYEVPGTADVVGRSQSMLVVVDKKGFDEVTPIQRNAQVRFCGMVAAKTYGYDDVTIAIRPQIGGLDVDEIGAFDFVNVHEHTKRALVGVNKAILDARQGKPVRFEIGRRCRWCDAFDDCPQQRELIENVRSELVPLQVENMIPFADDAEATLAFDLLSRLKILTKRLQGSLIMRSKERAIPTSDGKLYGPHEVAGDLKIDGDVAYAVMREKHGQDVADKAVIRKASQSGIERALKDVAPRGQLAAMQRAVMKEIELRGGSKRETSIEIGVYAPALALKEAG